MQISNFFTNRFGLIRDYVNGNFYILSTAGNQIFFCNEIVLQTFTKKRKWNNGNLKSFQITFRLHLPYWINLFSEYIWSPCWPRINQNYFLDFCTSASSDEEIYAKALFFKSMNVLAIDSSAQIKWKLWSNGVCVVFHFLRENVNLRCPQAFLHPQYFTIRRLKASLILRYLKGKLFLIKQ